MISSSRPGRRRRGQVGASSLVENSDVRVGDLVDGERRSHLHDGLASPRRLHAVHRVEGRVPGGAGEFRFAPLGLHVCEVAERDGVSPLEGGRLSGRYGVFELLFGAGEVSDVTECVASLVCEGRLAEEEDSGGFIAAWCRGGEVALGPDKR